jgi:hypothetical protein
MKFLPMLAFGREVRVSKHSKGQAILIVLLLMAVVLAIALYRVSSSITDITITSTDEASERAFAAAEAGIEEALLIDTTVGSSESPVTIGSGGDFSEYYVELDNPPTQNLFKSPPLRTGEEAVVWFTQFDANGMPSCPAGNNNCFDERYFDFLCFGSRGAETYTGEGGDNPDPAVLLTFYVSELDGSGNPSWLSTGNFDAIRTVSVGLDPIAGRAEKNGFLTGGFLIHPPGPVCEIDGVSYKYRLRRYEFYNFREELIPGGFDPGGFRSANRLKTGYVIMMAAKVLYTAENSEESVAVDQRAGGVTKLPSQGNYFISTGTSGEATRKIRVFKNVENALDVFLGKAVFSLSNLRK